MAGGTSTSGGGKKWQEVASGGQEKWKALITAGGRPAATAAARRSRVSAAAATSGSDYSMRFKNLMNKIMASPPLSENYNSVRSE